MGKNYSFIVRTRADRPDANPLNAKLAKVAGKSKGPSILLRVLAGDTISISAKAFYNMDNALPGQGIDIAPVLGSAIATMSNPTGTVLSEATRLAVDLDAEASRSVVLRPALQDDDSQKEVKPRSGINFILYNNHMEVVEENTGVLLVEDKINRIQVLASDNLIMQEAGFLEVYINNEAQTPVYYDNFTVAATTSNVVEINAYDPYGMIMPGLSLMAPPDKWNGYKYSAKELETALKLGVYNFGNRMQDPVIGRFMVPDRFAEKYSWLSPYSYAANNPINNIDVNGDYLVIVFGDNQMRVYEFGTTEEEDEEDEFFKSTVRALNLLGSKKFGGFLIGELQNSEFKYNISYGEQSKAEHIYTDFKMEDGVMKTGASMEWNGSDLMGLGHEIGHGWDAMNGYDISKRNIDSDFEMPLSEVRGVHIENILRAERGMELRTHYFTNEKTKGYDFSKPALLKNGREVRFGYDYRKQNVPYNYGRGVYLRSNPYLAPRPMQPLKLGR